MSEKKKRYVLSRRRRERLERLTLRFDLISAGLAVVIILAAAVSAGRQEGRQFLTGTANFLDERAGRHMPYIVGAETNL